jgi:hypothetical protein
MKLYGNSAGGSDVPPTVQRQLCGAPMSFMVRRERHMSFNGVGSFTLAPLETRKTVPFTSDVRKRDRNFAARRSAMTA